MKKVQKLKDKYGGLKTFLLLLVIVMFINGLIIYIIDISQKSFKIDDTKFRYVSRENRKLTFKDNKDNELIILMKRKGMFLNLFSDNASIDYMGSTIRLETDHPNFEYSIYVDDELIYNEALIKHSFNLDEEDVNNDLFEVQLIRKISEVYHYVSEIGMFNLVFYSLIFAVLGLVEIIFPKELWKFNYFLMVKNGEPTDFYYSMSRGIGIFMLVLSVIMPLFMGLS